MRAVLLMGYGGVDELELRDVPEPVAGPGEIKVRLAASSVNPIDVKLRSGAMRQWSPLDLPAMGIDFYAFAGHKAYGPNGIGVL